MTKGTKRYTVVLPQELFDNVKQLADERQTTVIDLLRRFVKLGLLAAQLESSPDSALILREGDTEKQIILL
jgi:hypothetical protein